MGGLMFIFIRKYTKVRSVADAARRAKSGIGQILRESHGFRSYYVLDGGEGVGVAVMIFEDRESANAANDKVLEFVQASLLDLNLGDPEIMAGEVLVNIHDACEEIARSELGLEIYPNQIEVITAEQMLDAYSSAGMPLFYKHWSFGKHFAYHEAFYRKGIMGLAYEIVINSSPCISYLMEENTATMQALVIAHAAFGHNHFFKNNYLFKQW